MPEPRTDRPADLIAIGRLLSAFGIKGFNRIALFGDDPDRIEDGLEVLIGLSASTVKPDAIEHVLVQGNGTMVKLASVPDRTGAERAVGLTLFVDRERAVKPRRGTWFVHDIIGCAVVVDDGIELGRVTDVQQYPAQDMWIVRSPDREVMIPAVKLFIKNVDLRKKIITVQNTDQFLVE